jgi:hypothetical protein
MKIEDVEQEKFKEWILKAALILPGLLGLSSSFSSIQYIVQSTADTIDSIIFIDNWLPWFAVLFFALGWITVHWIEYSLLSNHIGFAKLLFIVFLIEPGVFGSYFRYFNTHEVLHRTSGMILMLIMSGGYLRYSMFRNETLLIQKKIIYRRNTKP